MSRPANFATERDEHIWDWKETILDHYLGAGQVQHFDPGTGDNIFFISNQIVAAESALPEVESRLSRYGDRVVAPSYQLRRDGRVPMGASAVPGAATFELDPARGVNAAELALELTDGRLDQVAPNHVAFGLQFRRGFPDGDPEPADGATLPDLPLPIPSVGAGVRVAIIDTGLPVRMPQDLRWFDHLVENHTAFGEVDDNGKELRNVDRLDDDHDGYLDAEAGHALFIAGLVRRAAPSAELVFLKALNSDGIGTEYGVARAIRYALGRKVHVLNLSLGFYTLQDSTPHGMRAAVDAARAAGVAVVAASGNDGLSSPTFPSAFDDVIAVGAHDRATGRRAPFSNVGPWVNVTAPGVREVSCYVAGTEDPSTTRDGDADTFERQRPAAAWSGTSFACGHVSGHLAAALDPTSDRSPALQASEIVAAIPTDDEGIHRLDPVAVF